MKIIEERLMKALDDPATTRKQQKQEMHELLKSLAERWPSADEFNEARE